MEEKNQTANVALGAGIGVIVLQFLSFCLGLIPFVGILLFMVIFVLDIVAIGAGFKGRKEAEALGGAGKTQAIIGMAIGILHILIGLGLVAVMFLMGGIAMVLSLVSG